MKIRNFLLVTIFAALASTASTLCIPQDNAIDATLTNLARQQGRDRAVSLISFVDQFPSELSPKQLERLENIIKMPIVLDGVPDETNLNARLAEARDFIQTIKASSPRQSSSSKQPSPRTNAPVSKQSSANDLINTLSDIERETDQELKAALLLNVIDDRVDSQNLDRIASIAQSLPQQLKVKVLDAVNTIRVIRDIRMVKETKAATQENQFKTISPVPQAPHSSPRTSPSSSGIVQVQVQSQEGASCGYHAAKNAALIANDLITSDRRNFEKTRNQQFTAEKCGSEGAWRRMITAQVQQQKINIAQISVKNHQPISSGEASSVVSVPDTWDGDNIDAFQVNAVLKAAILEEIFSLQVPDTADEIDAALNSVVLDHNPPLYINVFSSANDFNNHEAWFNELRSKERFIATIAIGTHDSSLPSGSDIIGMHWFTMVIYRSAKDRTEYFVADSMGNASRINDPSVQAIKNRLETGVFTQELQQSSAIQQESVASLEQELLAYARDYATRIPDTAMQEHIVQRYIAYRNSKLPKAITDFIDRLNQ